MQKIQQIPVRLHSPLCSRPAVSDRLSALVLAIVYEIEAGLEEHLRSGNNTCIDILRTPLSPSERRQLADFLGTGEITAQIDCMGKTEVRETSVPCVWWIVHRNPDGEIQGMYAEITTVPAILSADSTAIPHGLELLRRRAAEIEPESASTESITPATRKLP